jgi:hypothetical protein
MSIDHIQGLDQDAWNRWVAYRSAIKKPLKEVSLHAAALKLSKYGKDQAEVVDQSISNQWQGLFELKKKRDPAEPPVKTDKQKQADDARFQYQLDGNSKMWNEKTDPIGRLRLCEALLARYTMNPDPDTPERIEWLRGRVADLIRQTELHKVAGDPHLLSMVRALWGEGKANKLREIDRQHWRVWTAPATSGLVQ